MKGHVTGSRWRRRTDLLSRRHMRGPVASGASLRRKVKRLLAIFDVANPGKPYGHEIRARRRPL